MPDVISIHYQTTLITCGSSNLTHNFISPQYQTSCDKQSLQILIDFSLTVKATTLIFISGRGSAIPSAKEGKSGFIYNFIKS